IGLDRDTGWRRVEDLIEVPPEAVAVQLVVMTHASFGVLQVDDIAVQDAMAGHSAVDTTGWIEYGADTLTTRGTMGDMSRFNERPAGRHGFLTVKGDQFTFEDGTGPFRFWGVAIAGDASLPDKETAGAVAGRLAAMGVNCVRFHHLENTWSGPRTIIDYSATTPDGKPTSRVRNPEMLDLLHYFMARLKAEGIYIYLDLITSRQFQSGDGCPIWHPGDKGMDCKGIIGHPAVRGLLKEFNEKLLTTPNPYTGLAPVNDPAIILSEVINEDDLALERQCRSDQGPYGAFYRQRFNTWLRRRYSSEGEILKAWQVPGEPSPLRDGEDLHDLSLSHGYEVSTWSRVLYERYRDGSDERRFMHRDEDRLRFWDMIQREAWQDVIAHARGLGYRAPMTGSNMPATHLHSRLANVQLGQWCDEHSYFNLGGWCHWKNEPIRNVNELTVPPGDLRLKAMLAPADYPFTLSEWNTCNDIDTAYVHVPHYAFRMAFHGWSGGNHFAFSWGSPPERSGGLSMEQHVGLIGQWPIAALMFRRGDLAVGEKKVIEFPVEKIFDFDYHSGGGRPLPWGAIDRRLAAAENIKTRFVDRPGAGVKIPELDASLVDEENGMLLTGTGQVMWDYGRGALFINTPRTVWAAGEFGGGTEQLGPVTIELDNPGASIAVTALDGMRPIRQARRLFIMAVARAYATGAVYNRSRTYVKEHGHLPLVGEPVRAKLQIETPGARACHVIAYGPEGKPAGVPSHVLVDGVLTIRLGREQARGFYYGVEIRR
ncbi:MAG: hypothetical protein KAX44_06215, partial [Candidatus Brocadiae bacterium]|nr:hypothetical protein [Candidatus Brocadiia bacterium]